MTSIGRFLEARTRDQKSPQAERREATRPRRTSDACPPQPKGEGGRLVKGASRRPAPLNFLPGAEDENKPRAHPRRENDGACRKCPKANDANGAKEIGDAKGCAPARDDDDDAFDRGELEESAEARRKREEWERYHAQAMRERDEGRRKMFTTYLLWTICPHKACQRAKACVGDDTEECRRERWRVAVPDEVRAEFAKVCELVSEGYDA